MCEQSAIEGNSAMDTDNGLRIEREQQKLAQEHARDEEYYGDYYEWDEADPETYAESYNEWDEADPENYHDELEVLDELKGETANIEPGTAATRSQSNTGDFTYGSSSKPC
jgi:hypothetical protein